MAKLAELLVGDTNTGKVSNWKVAKLHSVLLVLALEQHLFGIRTRFDKITDLLILKCCDPILLYPFLHY